MQCELLAGGGRLDAVDKLDPRERRSVNPAIEEPLERSIRDLLHRAPEIVGADLAKPRLGVELAHTAEEHVVPNQTPEHVKNDGTLVVHKGTKDAAVVANVPEPIAEIYGPVVRLVHARPAHFAHDRSEDAVAASVLGVQSREILGEAFA